MNPRDRSSPPAQDPPSQIKVESVMQSVDSLLDDGRLAEAHLRLSSLYGNPAVPPDYAKELTRLLDQMAATVIYSRQHLIEPAYKVQSGDSLERIANQYSIPTQVLAKINGIRDPQTLTAGRELKVIRGPFDAQVDLTRLEMTLMLQGRYAGRFPISIGNENPNLDKTFIVRDKQTSADGLSDTAASRSPGKYWIDLGGQVSIQNANDVRAGDRGGAGVVIRLGDRDMEDIYGILSVGSRVVIQR